MSDHDPQSTAELELRYRDMPTWHLKRAAVSFHAYGPQAHRRGAEVVAFYQRRLAVIQQVLEERGESFSPEGKLFV